MNIDRVAVVSVLTSAFSILVISILGFIGYVINAYSVITTCIHSNAPLSEFPIRFWIEVVGVFPPVGFIGSVMGWLHIFHP